MIPRHGEVWLVDMGMENVQRLLLDFAARENVGPRLLLALAGQEFQVVQDFAQHRLGLVLDFFNQNFLRAHGGQSVLARGFEVKSGVALTS